MADEHLLRDFDEEMLRAYQCALLEEGCKAARIFTMLAKMGGLQTARTLIHAPEVSLGFEALRERKRLDLTVEAVVNDNPKWHPLFTPDELAICRKRLESYGYSQRS